MLERNTLFELHAINILITLNELNHREKGDSSVRERESEIVMVTLHDKLICFWMNQEEEDKR